MVGEQRTYDNIEDQIVVITGASSGIGMEAAREFAKLKATVIFACRDQDVTENIIQELVQETKNNKLHFIFLDLEQTDSVISFVEQFKQKFKYLNILINNSGIADFDQENVSGIEKIVKVNQIGWVLLTHQLIDYFNERGRIINIVSHMYTWIGEEIDILKAFKGDLDYRYAISQYFKVSSSLYLQQLLKDQNKDIKVLLVAPGAVNTEIFEKSLKNQVILRSLVRVMKVIMDPFLLTPNEASQTYLYAALRPYDQIKDEELYNFNIVSKLNEDVIRFNQGQEIYETSLKLGFKDMELPSIKISKLHYNQIGNNQKTSWPECVGKTIQQAIQIIKKDGPNLQIQVLPEGSIVTMDYRRDRVRIFHNPKGIVIQIPSIG
ncbi:unnamed protein product (macronuclear) [Paramecium tetraurelia]|uniref:Uncharacterized protein n=1 Tax=Paramecium tetraurelia TaxID=5888 RepID=A0EEX1_PARTE|nr:uncharacterized protein GSPATT00026185001 [Paramecium tetraurelia]CAK93862.1 unnamed protein product [Paramecium tetraurelia]|eukprot:XP_001461235.1 hypothetical protein (macronuclear) [Paramecium tetraurelia strain d4-2]